MTPILDKREEGLRALARMISAAYRRRMIGETVTTFTASNGEEEHPYLKTRAKQNTEPEDLRHEGEYSETVRVDNFIRNKRRQGNTKE